MQPQPQQRSVARVGWRGVGDDQLGQLSRVQSYPAEPPRLLAYYAHVPAAGTVSGYGLYPHRLAEQSAREHLARLQRIVRGQGRNPRVGI